MGISCYRFSESRLLPSRVFGAVLVALNSFAIGDPKNDGKALTMPDWLPDRDLCYVEYCNNYDDLQRLLCCPSGAKTETRKNGGAYCLESATCSINFHHQVAKCKHHALNDGLRQNRIKRYMFTPSCGGTAQALRLPAWLPDRDECYIEYCNYYDELQRKFCCALGAAKTQASNGGWYCAEKNKTTCNATHIDQVKACKRHANHVGLYEGLIKPYIFSKSCGGSTEASRLPDWIPDRDTCYIEYCNYYDDLQRAFCCAPGAEKKQASNGKWYCPESTNCTVTHSEQVRDCKNHMNSSGIDQGRIKRYIFSPVCGGIEALALPNWLIDRDLCYIEYCNHYQDLQREHCCPLGAEKKQASNGGWYCAQNTTCSITHSYQIHGCKRHAKNVGIYQGRIKPYIFSKSCGGTAQAFPLPKWLVRREVCFIEYCNHYNDLQREFCCPPNVERRQESDGGWRCNESTDCSFTNDKQAADCKQHANKTGIYEGRVKQPIFSSSCGGTLQAPSYYTEIGLGYCVDSSSRRPPQCHKDGQSSTQIMANTSKRANCEHLCDTDDACEGYEFEEPVDLSVYYCRLIYTAGLKACPSGFFFLSAGGGNAIVRTQPGKGKCYKKVLKLGANATESEETLIVPLGGAPRGVNALRVSMLLIFCGFSAICGRQLYARYGGRASLQGHSSDVQLSSHSFYDFDDDVTIGGPLAAGHASYHSLSTPRGRH